MRRTFFSLSLPHHPSLRYPALIRPASSSPSTPTGASPNPTPPTPNPRPSMTRMADRHPPSRLEHRRPRQRGRSQPRSRRLLPHRHRLVPPHAHHRQNSTPPNASYIAFDGIMANSDVYCNGELLGHRPYGYVSFNYDLTPHLHAGKNIIAVRVDNSQQPASRWYPGAGINRHVRLITTNATHIAPWGTFVTTPEVSAESRPSCHCSPFPMTPAINRRRHCFP